MALPGMDQLDPLGWKMPLSDPNFTTIPSPQRETQERTKCDVKENLMRMFLRKQDCEVLRSFCSTSPQSLISVAKECVSASQNAVFREAKGVKRREAGIAGEEQCVQQGDMPLNDL